MRKGPVTLTTDFGEAGYHVGVMKGVILSANPGAAMVDLCHTIAPGDVEEGAWTLLWSWRYFPRGTVHLAVIDPGVGGTRRALAVSAAGHFFVGPDNGLLIPAIADTGEKEPVFVHLADDGGEVSRTFHGRDVFAPAAAALSTGKPIGELGEALSDPVNVTLPLPRRASPGTLEGKIISIDRFGNAVTNVTTKDLESEGLHRRALVTVGGREVKFSCGCYSEGDRGEPLALINSSGHLEIALYGGRAADVLNLDKEYPLRVCRTR